MFPLDRTHELRWLYIDFNSYFASVEQQLQPHLRGKPIAVVPVETDATCAIAASYEAKAFGIRTGTPVWEAKKLCPDLICVLARHEHYLAYHQRILEEVNNHLPVTQVCSIDEVACRLMANEMVLERVLAIAHGIKRGLAMRVGEHVRCSIGIAPNRYLAKVATDLQKPNGLVVLPATEVRARLNHLALRDLPGIGHNMEIRLRKAGIHQVDQLFTLDAATMRKVWGSLWGEKMWYYLRGAEVQEKETNRSTVGHSHVLAPECRPPEQARLIARRLTLKAASRLRRIHYYATQFHLSVRMENGERFEYDARCFRAQDSLTFLSMLEEGWEQIRRQSKQARMKKVSVSLNGLSAAHTLQEDLFQALPQPALIKRQRAEIVSHTLDALNQRFGRDTVQIGLVRQQTSHFTGTKIAFTRIPDAEEFIE